MGFMDNITGKAKDAAQQHPDQVKQGVEKAGDQVDQRTDNKYSDQVDKGQEFVEGKIGGDQQK